MQNVGAWTLICRSLDNEIEILEESPNGFVQATFRFTVPQWRTTVWMQFNSGKENVSEVLLKMDVFNF